ncbi:MAG: helix-turn-helix transcriptional regulator [Gilliamella sp.]|uniref:helix-turn-helix domain-containing protein n=1 Tax=Gilliamella sp. TaxID=1891236 RepID=UPI0025EE68FD|nr:helix-turn-helix transcriptional regulator [Gilliamella sp.]MCO6528756.1 helix-turn-helix transcriptional regulator [Lactobacillus sp.]MCO6538449.1 helix-turn-helix transcriptional regulator [Gilliamella sp.]
MKQEIKLLSQGEIAERIGISKSTLSKWLSKNNISAETTKGNKKFYRETIIQQYHNSHKPHSDSASNGFSTIDFLQKELQQKQQEINDLKQEGKQKDSTIADLASKLAKLADQAQQLNLTDKDDSKLNRLTGNDVQKEPVDIKRQHWWEKIFK